MTAAGQASASTEPSSGWRLEPGPTVESSLGSVRSRTMSMFSWFVLASEAEPNSRRVAFHMDGMCPELCRRMSKRRSTIRIARGRWRMSIRHAVPYLERNNKRMPKLWDFHKWRPLPKSALRFLKVGLPVMRSADMLLYKKKLHFDVESAAEACSLREKGIKWLSRFIIRFAMSNQAAQQRCISINDTSIMRSALGMLL